MKRLTLNLRTTFLELPKLSKVVCSIKISFRTITALLAVMHCNTAFAQSCTQLGQGAGGQLRATYLYKNGANNYDFYLGSDVSGVWRVKGINPNAINDPDQYQYEYIIYDNLLWFNDNSQDYYYSVKAATTCGTSITTSIAAPCTTKKDFSDAFFITKAGTDLFAGIGEGFSTNQFNGYVLQLQSGSNTWIQEGNTLCGDPKKFFVINGIKYVLVYGEHIVNGDNEKQNRLFWLNGSTWTLIDLWPNPGDENLDEDLSDVDMIYNASIEHLVAIRKHGHISNKPAVYHFTGSSGNFNNIVCSVAPSNLQDATLKKLKILKFGTNDFKILCSSVPNLNTTNATEHLFEMDKSNACSLDEIASNTFLTKLNKDDLVGDDGITAMEINEDLHIIYVAAVSKIGPKSHLFKTNYDPTTGVISTASWSEISGNIPNKSLIYLNAFGSNQPCSEYIYACARGLDAWKIETNPVTFDPAHTTATLCSGDGTGVATAISPFTGTVSYLWSANNQTTQTATGLSIGTYTVTVTQATIGCTATATVAILQDPFCCNAFANYLHQSDFDTPTNLNSVVIPPGNYNLNENIVCNHITIMNNVHLSIKEGVKIVVPAGITLHIGQNSIFESCGNMWEGIIVEQSGILEVYDSEINDAQYGIHAKDDCIIISKYSQFKGNYAGLYIDGLGSPTQSKSTPVIILEGISFIGKYSAAGNVLKGGYSGQQPEPGQNAFAGIMAVNAAFTVDANNDVNLFDGLYRGFSLEKSDVYVRNSRFQNMILQSEYHINHTEAAGGIGIFSDMATSGWLKQTNNISNSSNLMSFNNCHWGIYSIGGNVVISKNLMTNMTNGISCKSVIAQDISITNNEIHALRKGISLNDNDYAANINVKYNNITTSGATAQGISVYEFKNASSNRRFNIDCNIINVDEGTDGIMINAANRIAMQQNSVTLNSQTMSSNGVHLDGSSGCSLIENSVIGNGTNRHIGYEADASQYCFYANNHVTETQVGFEFLNGCQMDENFKGNTLGNHDIGIKVNNNGIIGTQTHRGNKWIGSYSSWGAENQNSNSDFITDYPIIVHEQNSGATFHPTENAITPWFKYLPSITWFAAYYDNFCTNPSSIQQNPIVNLLSATDTLIVLDSISAIEYEAELKHITRHDLQDKLNANDSLVNTNTFFENFYNFNDTTALGILSKISSNLSRTDSSFFPLIALDSLLRHEMDSLIYIDSLMHQNQSNVLLNQRHLVLAVIQWVIVQRDSILSLQKNNLNLKYNLSKLSNQEIVSSNFLEFYEMKINDFRFTYYDSLLLNIPVGHIDTVKFIAGLCPFAFGKAVFKARSELARYGIDTIAYDDKAICAQLGYLRQMQDQNIIDKEQKFIIKAYPNPTKDFVFINSSLTNLFSSCIVIRDCLGKIVLLKMLNSPSDYEKLNLSVLSNGVYNLTVETVDFKTNQVKIVVIK